MPRRRAPGLSLLELLERLRAVQGRAAAELAIAALTRMSEEGPRARLVGSGR